VHRDLKPSNVLLTPAQLPGRAFRAKLADFGIAHLVDHTRVTSPGDIIGTAAYLAPEQVNGAAPAFPADIYALGLVLIEALTGEPAFPHAVGVASALARLHAAPELPDHLGPGWRDLLERMTRIDPDARPQALEVAVAASAFAVTGAVTVSPAVATPSVAPAVALPVDEEPAVTTVIPAPTPAAEPEVTAAIAADDRADAAAPTALLSLDADDPEPAQVPAAASEGRRGRRRGMLVGAAAAGAVIAVGLGAWGLGAFGGTDDEPADLPALTEPSPSRTPTPTVSVPADDLVSEEQPVEDDEPNTPSPVESEQPERPSPAPSQPEPEPTVSEAPDPEPEPEPEPDPEPEPTTPVETPVPDEPAPSPTTPAP
jgi:eukaryotic-like serine/threonine-protein kinase